MLDIESLLQPVAADARGGPNLEYTSAFAELERSLRGKPERQIGQTIVAGEDPDWATVVAAASALLTASKDLRIAIPLARGLLATDGYRGLAEGLALIAQLVVRYWPVLHPTLDEEDNDGTARINAMAALTHRDMLQAIRSARIVHAKAFGVVTLRTFEDAGIADAGGKGNAVGSAEAALDAVPVAELTEAARWIDQCDQAAKEIEEGWTSRIDSGAPDFADLRRLLAQANTIMKGRGAARQSATVADAEPGDRGAEPIGASVSRGELRTRDDVVRALEGLCAYYARHEPSSPVPLLLERCKRLVTMSFLDIVKEMLPDGLSTIQTIAGRQND